MDPGEVLERLRKGLRPAHEPAAGTVEGAVLIPLQTTGTELSVLLTLRPAHIRSHAGQVSFPGGSLEPGEDPLAGALRETEEEVGLQPSSLDVLGRLDDTLGPGFRQIRAFVATVAPGARPVPNPAEVEKAYGVPMGQLARTDAYEGRIIDPLGGDAWGGYVIHVFHVPPKPVWGFTGRLLADVLEIGLGWGPPRAPRVYPSREAVWQGLP